MHCPGRCGGLRLGKQPSERVQMVLPICRVKVGVANRVAAVEHYSVTYVNPDVRNAGRVVGAIVM
jgi:hypothetical protein